MTDGGARKVSRDPSLSSSLASVDDDDAAAAASTLVPAAENDRWARCEWDDLERIEDDVQIAPACTFKG